LARPLRPWMQLRSLGSSALNLRGHHLSIGVHAPFAPSALPRRSLASVARPGSLSGSPCDSLSVAVQSPFRFPFAKLSLPEVLRPFSGLCRASSTHCFPSQHARSVLPVFLALLRGPLPHLSLGHIQGSFALFAPLHQHLPGLFHPGTTLGVLPSEVCSHPEPDTSRLALSCLPLATMATSRSRAFRPAGLSTSPSLVLVCRCPARSCERPLHRTALLAVIPRVSCSVSGCPLRLPWSNGCSVPRHRFSCTRTTLSRARIPGIKPRTCALSRGVFYALAELAPLLAVAPSRG